MPATMEEIESRIEDLVSQLEDIEDRSVKGHGDIINHGKRFEVDISVRLTELMKKIDINTTSYDEFIELKDTPSEYTETSGNILLVNRTEDGLEFTDKILVDLGAETVNIDLDVRIGDDGVPEAPLQVVADSKGLRISEATDIRNRINLYEDASTGGHLLFTSSGGSRYRGTISGNDLYFRTYNNGWQDRVIIDSNGVALFLNKIAFTQTDLNEYINSLADGYLDYVATTAHRFNTDKLTISSTEIITQLASIKTGEAEHNADDTYLRCDKNTGEIYGIVPS